MRCRETSRCSSDVVGRRLRVVAAAVMLLLASVACQVGVHATIRDERSMSVEVSIALSRQLVRVATLSGQFPDGPSAGQLRELIARDPDALWRDQSYFTLAYHDPDLMVDIAREAGAVNGVPISVRKYDEDGFTGMTLTFEASLRELQGLLAFASEGSLSMRRTAADDGWRISGDSGLDTLIQAVISQADIPEGTVVENLIDVRFSVDPPGEVVESNAVEVIDGVAYWDITLRSSTFAMVSRDAGLPSEEGVIRDATPVRGSVGTGGNSSGADEGFPWLAVYTGAGGFALGAVLVGIVLYVRRLSARRAERAWRSGYESATREHSQRGGAGWTRDGDWDRYADSGAIPMGDGSDPADPNLDRRP